MTRDEQIYKREQQTYYHWNKAALWGESFFTREEAIEQWLKNNPGRNDVPEIVEIPASRTRN